MQRASSSSSPHQIGNTTNKTTAYSNTTTTSTSASKMKSSLFGGPRRTGNSAGGHSNIPQNSEGRNNNNNGARSSYKMEDEEEVRRDNDQNLNGLHDDLGRLRREAEFLRGEVASQNELIDTVQNYMIGARDGIVGSISKLDQTMKKYGVKHTLFFAVAMCGAFFVFVYLVKGMLFGRGGSEPSSSSSSAAGGLDRSGMVAQQAVTNAILGILAPEKPIEAPPVQLVPNE